MELIQSQATLDAKTSKKILELALDQREEESEEDGFGVLDATMSDKTAPRPTKQIDEDDEDDDDDGMAPSDDEGIDLDAELELVSQ